MWRALIAAAWVGALAAAAPADAQDWPTRPVTMVVPFAAGGANDVMARVLMQQVSENLGQQVVIENIAGAGGMTGANRVAKASPDGYTFVMGSSPTHAYSQTIHKQPLYNAVADFAPVVLIADQPLILVTRKDLPVANLGEFIAYAKANGPKMQYGSAGVGSSTHLACILLNQTAGIDVTHIPYRGGAPVLQDLLAGRIDYWCGISTTAMPQIKAGTIKSIAMLAPDRLALLPDLPTAHEQGLANFDASTWNGFFMPKGTPEPIIRKLHAATNEALKVPLVQRRLNELGATIVAPERRSPEYLAKFVVSEIAKWAVPIKAAGISIE